MAISAMLTDLLVEFLIHYGFLDSFFGICLSGVDILAADHSRNCNDSNRLTGRTVFFIGRTSPW
jgi:hypothetical protein